MKKFVSLIAAEDPTQTHHWLLPETAEIIYGGLATVIVVTLLVKFAGPMVKKSMADRTAEVRDMEVKAEADIAAAAARSGDELRAEISRLSAQAAERAVASALDDRAQQDLIESFISSVGAAR
jgi:F-type H+-transporting ATPase subunit b